MEHEETKVKENKKEKPEEGSPSLFSFIAFAVCPIHGSIMQLDGDIDLQIFSPLGGKTLQMKLIHTFTGTGRNINARDPIRLILKELN